MMDPHVHGLTELGDGESSPMMRVTMGAPSGQRAARRRAPPEHARAAAASSSRSGVAFSRANTVASGSAYREALYNLVDKNYADKKR